jgi:xanthine dehydrogenase accessory factor
MLSLEKGAFSSSHNLKLNIPQLLPPYSTQRPTFNTQHFLLFVNFVQMKTWHFIQKNLVAGKPVMLLYVLESHGSSPGRQGFFMAVNGSGEMEGSIGGGIMEHKFVEMAKEQLNTKTSIHSDIRKQVHDKSAAKNQSGMICSGEQSILLYLLQKKDLSTITNLLDSLEKNENGSLTLSPAGLAFNEEVPASDFAFHYTSDEDWLYKEKTGYKNNLYVIGGGHCALAFCKLMRSMDFYIRLYDDRKALKTMEENDGAHEKHYINDFSELASLIESSPNGYVVVMTFGYRTDDLVVRAIINKDFAYVGLLGSKTKIEKMFAAYRAEGINENRLQRIHAPVGLRINSQTPQEIAVSIAAEIIKVKNAR